MDTFQSKKTRWPPSEDSQRHEIKTTASTVGGLGEINLERRNLDIFDHVKI